MHAQAAAPLLLFPLFQQADDYKIRLATNWPDSDEDPMCQVQKGQASDFSYALPPKDEHNYEDDLAYLVPEGWAHWSNGWLSSVRSEEVRSPGTAMAKH